MSILDTQIPLDNNGFVPVVQQGASPLAVGASTEATLAAVLAKLIANPATETTLAAILAKLITSPATEATLAAVNTKLGAALPLPAGASTEATLLNLYNKINGGTTNVARSNQATANITSTINLGASLGSATAAIGGRTVLRIRVPSTWTAAVMTFQFSDDGGTTYEELVDENSVPYQIQPTAGRNHWIALGPLTGVNLIRPRSGTLANPVNQAANATINFVVQGL